MTEKKKVNIPKKGAGKRLAERLNKISNRKLPVEILDILNQVENPKSENTKKIAIPEKSQNDLDI